MDEPLQPLNPAPPTIPLQPGRKSMNNEALKMGLMMGALLIAYSLVLHFTGMITNKGLGWISYALMFIGMFLGVKTYRDSQLGGVMSFGQAFGMGFRIVIYAALLLTAYTYLYYKTFGHDMIGVMRDMMLDELAKNEQISESQAETMTEMYNKWVFIPGALAVGAFLGTLFLGTIISLINAAILKRQPEQLEPPMP
jgi:hypothetical protein